MTGAIQIEKTTRISRRMVSTGEPSRATTGELSLRRDSGRQSPVKLEETDLAAIDPSLSGSTLADRD
jgi:hypothetical protein